LRDRKEKENSGKYENKIEGGKGRNNQISPVLRRN